MNKVYFECFKSFFFFFCLIYIPGLIFFPFFYEGYSSYFSFTGGLYLNSFILFTFFLSITFLSFFVLNKIPYLKFKFLNSNQCLFIISIVVIIYFLLSLNFFLEYTSSFRHKNRLSNAGPLVSLLFLLRPIVSFLVCLIFIKILNGGVIGKMTKFLLFLVVIASVLSLNSSLQVIMIILMIGMIFLPNLFTKNISGLKIKYIILLLIFGPLSCIAVLFIGIGNKVGYDYIVSSEGLYFITNYGNILFPRMSTSLFSSVILLNNTFDGIFYSNDVINGVGDTLSNRFSFLLSTNVFDTSMINTVNRLNYLEVFNNHAERAGASPGLLSSVFYTPFFPMTIFVIPIYIAFVFRNLCVHMKKTQFNFISYLILPYFIINLFESPLNVFYVLDPVFFLFLTVVFFGRFVNVDDVFSK